MTHWRIDEHGRVHHAPTSTTIDASSHGRAFLTALRKLLPWTAQEQGSPRYITFDWAGQSASGLTQIHRVVNYTNDPRGETLGRIRWFGRWRKYAFEPAPNTIFEQDCLRDIAAFCEDLTAAHYRKDEPCPQTRSS